MQDGRVRFIDALHLKPLLLDLNGIIKQGGLFVWIEDQRGEDGICMSTHLRPFSMSLSS